MGMILELRRCDRAELARIEAASEEDVFDTAFPDDLMDSAYDAGMAIDLDKSWHAIHFLLTGVAFTGELPEGFIFGGTAVSEDQGYGPIRVLSPEDVVEIAELLRDLSRERFLERYDAKALTDADVYPGIWLSGGTVEDETTKDYVGENYEVLRFFVVQASECGEGIVLSIG